jgi:superfamily II DNA/RNA helicase
MNHGSRLGSRRASPLSVAFSTTTSNESTFATSTTLPNLYPQFANILSSKGLVTPTPIQQSSALSAKDGENLLLIAATGSGKTLAYMLPTLSRTISDSIEPKTQRRTVLIVAPTRELSAQLARDASFLLPDDDDDANDINNGQMLSNVLLAVRGIPPPTPAQLGRATVLIGTPNELHTVLTRISGAQNFLAGDTLSGLILDEVDVLLPPAPKALRTTFDIGTGSSSGSSNDAQAERKKLEQRRKLRAAQRRGVEFHGGSSMKGKSSTTIDSPMDMTNNSMNGQVLTPTERLLRLIASSRHVGGGDRISMQVMAGSATASRAALDRLNRALSSASMEGGVIGSVGIKDVWGGMMKVCRPSADDVVENGSIGVSSATTTDAAHTIRAVTVPSVVDHRYVSMSKDSATSPHEILANVAKVARLKSPETSLVFICGEFSRSLTKEKEKVVAPKVSGKTSEARRNAKRGQVFVANKKKVETSNGGPEPLSVRKACSILQSLGVDAHPMHVVLGLEPNAGEDGTMIEDEDDRDREVDLPPVLVTFEGSARGLHFDGVDYVFVIGRPTSAASYLHLAGRVGRSMPAAHGISENGGGGGREVEVRPGTIVSFCSKGRVGELQKWTSQVGATELEEIVL